MGTESRTEGEFPAVSLREGVGIELRESSPPGNERLVTESLGEELIGLESPDFIVTPSLSKVVGTTTAWDDSCLKASS